jgi:hypothetical protein
LIFSKTEKTPRMNIIIHIGWHKTGTTSIQAFLKKNCQKLIQENKIYYPTEGLFNNAHHHLAWALSGVDASPWGKLNPINENTLIQQAIESGQKLGCQNLIFSSEKFCTFSEKQIVKLNEILNYANNKIIIVAYIRRQDLLIESSYNMEVKWWGSRMTDGFQQYVKSKTPFIKYDLALDAWATVFGLQNIKVKVYDTDYMPQNDIRLDFCHVTGIDSGNLIFDNKRINNSLGPKSLAFLRILNRLNITRIWHQIIVSILQKFEKSSKCVLFEPQQRIEFMKSLSVSNSRLKKFSINPDLLTLKKDAFLGKREKNNH